MKMQRIYRVAVSYCSRQQKNQNIIIHSGLIAIDELVAKPLTAIALITEKNQEPGLLYRVAVLLLQKDSNAAGYRVAVSYCSRQQKYQNIIIHSGLIAIDELVAKPITAIALITEKNQEPGLLYRVAV